MCEMPKRMQAVNKSGRLFDNCYEYGQHRCRVSRHPVGRVVLHNSSIRRMAVRFVSWTISHYFGLLHPVLMWHGPAGLCRGPCAVVGATERQ